MRLASKDEATYARSNLPQCVLAAAAVRTQHQYHLMATMPNQDRTRASGRRAILRLVDQGRMRMYSNMDNKGQEKRPICVSQRSSRSPGWPHGACPFSAHTHAHTRIPLAKPDAAVETRSSVRENSAPGRPPSLWKHPYTVLDEPGNSLPTDTQRPEHRRLAASAY